MIIIELIENIFPIQDRENYLIEDKYSSFNLAYQISFPENLSENQINSIFEVIPSVDTWRLQIFIGSDTPIILNSNIDTRGISDFISKINENREFSEGENVRLNLSINKSAKDGCINVYKYDSFLKFVDSLSTIAWLDLIKSDLIATGYLYFKVNGNDFCKFCSDHIFFDIENLNSKIETKNTEIRDLCHFGNLEQYPFTANHFYLLKRPKYDNSITRKLDILSGIFSIIGIFDITYIKNNALFYKINGYKSVSGEISLEHSINSREIFFKIYDWIYSEKSSRTDKVGLARNIISIYLNDNSIEISENVYTSILSGFRVYLKDNINKYIQVRSSIYEQLVLITQKINSVIDIYISNFQKSNFSFISFFISIFLLKVLSTGKYTDVFTKDTTIIFFGFLFLSLMYLFYSLWILNVEIKRIENKYINIKIRYEDLLVKDDINNILGNDIEFNEEIKFLKSRRLMFTVLWILTILIFLCAILSLSTYINWSTIF